MGEHRYIPGFEGIYTCSIVDGEIRSIDRFQEYVGGRGNVYHKRLLRGKTITPQIQSDGKHYSVNLSKNGKVKGYSVQQLVALTYPEICGTWFDGAVAHHIDGNPANNAPNNIKVISRQTHFSEHPKVNNNLVKYEKGHTPWNAGKENIKMRGENHPRSRDVLVYTTDFEVIGLYHSNTEVSKLIGCSQACVSQNCLGKTGPIYNKYYCEYL